MQGAEPTSWQAQLPVKAARAVGMTAATGRLPLRGELVVGQTGWSWTPNDRSAARGAVRIQPTDGWALVEVQTNRYGTDATLARRSGEFLRLLVGKGAGLSQWVVDADAGFPRPAPTRAGIALGIFVVLLVLAGSGEMFWIASRAVHPSSGSLGGRIGVLCLGLCGGVLLLAAAGYGTVLTSRSIRSRSRRGRVEPQPQGS